MNKMIHFFWGHRWVETGAATDDRYFGYRSRTQVYRCECGKWKVAETIHDMLKQRTYTMVNVTDQDPTTDFL